MTEEQIKKDAARYQWIRSWANVNEERSNAMNAALNSLTIAEPATPEEYDAFIDMMMEQVK